MAKRKGIEHHIIHKGKLSLLLILKIFFVFFSFLVVVAIFSFFSPLTDLDLGQVSSFNIIMWIIGLAVVVALYLFLIIRVLKLLKFK